MIHAQDKLQKMEKTFATLSEMVSNLRQNGNQSIWAKDIASIMDSRNRNFAEKLASQNKRASSPERRPEEPKLLTHMLELKDDVHKVFQKGYQSALRQINTDPKLWWAQKVYPT